MRLQDLAIVTNTQVDSNPTLLERFKGHDRVVWDPKTDLYSYKVGLTALHWQVVHIAALRYAVSIVSALQNPLR